MMTNDQVVMFRGTIYENGYGLIARAVMRDKNLKPQSKAIYAYLCSFAGNNDDNTRSAFPSVSLMKSELGIKSQDTFYKYMNQLKDAGYITVEKKREEGKFERNIYYIEAVPKPKEKDEVENEDTPSSKKSTTVKPQSKKSTTVKSTTNKSTTKKRNSIIKNSNINSINNNSFNNNIKNQNHNHNEQQEEENKKTNYDFDCDEHKKVSIINSKYFQFLFERMKERGFHEETIFDVGVCLYNLGINKFDQRPIRDVLNRIVEEIGNGKKFSDIRKYIVKSIYQELKNTVLPTQTSIENDHRENKRGEEKIKSYPFYNWLES